MSIPIKDILKEKLYNVNVVKDVEYDENVARRIKEAVDKNKAIGEILAEKLSAPGNVKFYIKLSYLYPFPFLLECVSLTNEASHSGRIKNSKSQYFYGIVKNRSKSNFLHNNKLS